MDLTHKQEAFCNAYIETGNASEAYRRAYDAGRMKPATINRKAAEVFANGKVTARLSEMRGNIASAHGVTVASLIAELEEARQVGKERGQASAMAVATMGKAKLAGLDKDVGDDAINSPQPAQVIVTVRDARKPNADA
jgi:hypothetical protein